MNQALPLRRCLPLVVLAASLQLTPGYYDPAAQRWISRDPIGETGGLNFYGFVLNAPLNRRDPSGLRVDEATDGPVWLLQQLARFAAWLRNQATASSEPDVLWAPPDCPAGELTAFVQVFRGGSGLAGGTGVDDGSHGGGGSPPMHPPLYPVEIGRPFQDTPRGPGTSGLQFVVCRVCLKRSAQGNGSQLELSSIGPCRGWNAGCKGDLGDKQLLADGTVQAYEKPPDWFKITVGGAFPGFLTGQPFGRAPH
jgi:hypothetical protein